jgi:MFS family permease
VRTKTVIALAAGLALADASIVTLALPRLLTELNTTVEGVAAVIGVYTVVMAVVLLPADRVRREIGSPRLATYSLALFAAACAGCAAANSIGVLLVLRAVQAVGGAGALVAAFDLLEAGDPAGRGRRLWSAAAVIGFAAGPVLGGVLTQAFDWRAIFVAQIPVALAGAAMAWQSGEPPHERPPAFADPLPRGPMAALGLVSAALTAVLFLLVLLLVAGWNLEPIVAALAVTVLPLAALAASRVKGDPRARAATGCVLVGGGTIALAFIPTAHAWWTILPQLLAGAGMGLALAALAGELIPERNPNEAAKLLTARSAGIAVALLLLAPIISSNLDSATERARERGVALILDSSLPPQDKLRLAPDLLASVQSDEPRRQLQRAVAKSTDRYQGSERAEVAHLGRRADDTLVQAMAESFRLAFLIAGALAVGAAFFVLPEPSRRTALARAGAVALVVPLLYLVLEATVAPEPVKIADPCKPRTLPKGSGVLGLVQDQALVTLDQEACHFGSSREELVLGLADKAEAKRYEEKYGVNPRSGGVLLQGLIGR